MFLNSQEIFLYTLWIFVTSSWIFVKEKNKIVAEIHNFKEFDIPRSYTKKSRSYTKEGGFDGI